MKLLKYACLYAFAFFISFGMVEIGLRKFNPMQYIVPASDFVPEYGVIAYPDQKIINAKPNHFHFVYTTNKLRYRGALTPFDSSTRKIILLGDSDVFGFGVQDDETVSYNLNNLLGSGFDVINLGNGGWSLPQQVRRYIELGQKYKPEVVILHMVENDIKDHVYGINWVSMATDKDGIELRNVPMNPVGRLRKFFPPDSLIYKIVFRSQVMMRIKILLNRYAMAHLKNVETSPDGNSRLINKDLEKKSVRIQYKQVTVFDKDENERRYNMLLEAFARQLKSANVRFIFLTQESGWDEEFDLGKISELANAGLLEHYFVDRWFVVGVDYPKNIQGHQWNADATKALANNLYQVMGISN